jgi:ATP-dependent helicase HrpA
VPLPDFAAEFCESVTFANGSLMDAVLKAVRDRTQLAVQRNDIKLEQLSPHLFMNFRVVDEHGRQLGIGRDLAGLKAQLGVQARSAFQALAVLKTRSVPANPAELLPLPHAGEGRGEGARGSKHLSAPTPSPQPSPALREREQGPATAQKFTAWNFGELPELLEVRRGDQVLVGFPALMDRGDHVEIEVFDEPDMAANKHRAGLRRLVALQLREPLKFLEKNIPGLQAMAGAYMVLGSLEDLRAQIIDLALDRAFLADPLPTDAGSFSRRMDEGRSRLNLIAQEVARQAGVVLSEWAAAQRKLKDSKPAREVVDDVQAQLQRLVEKQFLLKTPWPALQHLPRYLKAVVLRLDKLRADPARDQQRLAELRPLEQRYLRRLAELKGAAHARMDDYRWLLEELRVSLFAQELRTPQPVSAKRLDKAWAQMAD